MTHLINRRRAAVCGLAALVLSLLAIMVAGRADAAYPCGDNAFPQDVTLDLNDQYFVGVDIGSPTLFPHSVWACVAPGNGEPNATWVVVTADDPAVNPAPGAVVYAGGCNVPGLPSGGHPFSCQSILGATGAEVDVPSVTPNLPGGGPTGTGVNVGLGGGTCVHVNGATTCPGGTPVADVWVNENDVIPVVNGPGTASPPCTQVLGTCLPSVSANIGMDPADTASVTVLGTPVASPDLPRCTGVTINGTC